MSIQESQLETWSHLGAITTAKNTHESIRNALNRYEWPEGVRFEVYLQGSYRNATNIRGDSDVDVIVELTSTFQPDLFLLTEAAKQKFRSNYSNAVYSFEHFTEDVVRALREYYGTSAISLGNKSIKVTQGSNRLPADVVACMTYRKYKNYASISDQGYIHGILFRTRNEGRQVVNYPKLHYDKGVWKNSFEQTNGWY